MALTSPEPPPAAQQTLREGMERLPGRVKNAFSTAAAGGLSAEVSSAHEIFSLNAEEISNGAGLDAAQPVGWRYLVNQPANALIGGSVAAAAVVTGHEGSYEFSHLQHGWLASATARALAAAEKLPRVASEAFDVRLLSMPALFVDALWLKNTGAGEDLVVPIASLSKKLLPDQPYSPGEFLNILRDLSEERLQFDNAPGAPQQPR